MAIEDLNPYGAAGLKSFGSRTLSAMDASPDIPRVDDNYAGFGVNQLGLASVDAATLGQALNDVSPINEPSVGFNETTNQVFVNGLTFDADDYQTADRSASEEYLTRTPTGLPDGFRRLSPEAYGSYIDSIRNPGKFRLIGKNLGIGFDNLQMLGGAGLAFAGDSLGSETISGLGRDIIEQQQEDLRRKEPFQKTFTDDVVKEGELSDWFLANLAQQGPNLLESLAAFLVGATGASIAQGNPLTGVLTGVGTALGKGQIKKRLMNAVAKKQRGQPLDAGDQALVRGVAGIAAAIGNNYRTGVSDVYLELLESAEMKDPGAGQRLAALAAGIPYAAAETLSEAFVVSKFLNPVGTSRMFKRILKAAGAGAVAEGAAEGVQESTVIGTDALLNDKEIATEQNGIRLINAIAAGAAVGGPIAGLSGIRSDNSQPINMLDNDSGVSDTGTALAPIAPETGPTDRMGGGVDPNFTITPVNQVEFQEPTLEDNRPVTVAPVFPDFTVASDGTVDPSQQTFDPMNQPVNIQGAFFPGTAEQPQGALNVTPEVTTLNEVNQNLGTQQNTTPVLPPPSILSDPNQLDLPFEDQPDTVTTPPPRETQLPLFTPEEAPKQKPPAKPLTDNIPQSKTEFAPSTVPQLENRRNKKDLAATAKGENQISGGRQEDRITDPTLRKASFDKINYVAPDMGVIPPQVMQDKYAAAMRKIKLVDSKKKGVRGTNWKGAHHNGGVAIVSSYPYAQPITADLIAHELGHASHSLLAEQINDNPEILAELQAIEQTLYPGLRAAIEQAINDGKKLDNEFYNYLLSPEELIAEFNVFRLKQPDQAAQIAPVLTQLLESVEQAPDLVVDRKTFPTGFGTIVTKATGNFNGDLNFSANQRQQSSQARAVKRQRKADQLKKGVKKEEEQDAVQEPEATQVDAQEQTQASERVGEEVQETPRVRGKKKNLKKEKVEEQSVQADTQPKPKVDKLKRGKAKVVPQVAEREVTETKTPQPVVKQTPEEQWDANKPFPDSPSLADFKHEETKKILKAMSPEQMQNLWDDTLAIEALPSEASQVIILKDNVVNTVGEELVSNLTMLMDIAFVKPANSASPTARKDAGNFLLNTDFGIGNMPNVQKAAIDTISDLIIQDQLSFSGRPTWFKYAEQLDIMSAIEAKLRNQESLANFRKISDTLLDKQERVRKDIITNTQEINFSTLAKETYNDPKRGPKAQSNRISDLLSTLPQEINSRTNKTVQRIERYLSGFENAKPDLKQTYNGIPLADYFDDNGRLKMVERGNGKFVLSPGAMAKARKKERTAAQDLKDDKKLSEAIDETKAQDRAVRARKEQEAIESGYMRPEDAQYYKPRSVLDELDDPDGNFSRYADDKPVDPMNIGRAKLLLKSILRKFAVKPNVAVFKNVSDLKAKNPALYAKIIKDRPDFDTIPASGYSIGPDILIFTDFIKSEDHLKFTIAHEAMGHFGLRSLVSKSELKSVLENLYNTSSHIRGLADTYMEQHGIGKLEAIEEAIADHAAYLDTSVLQRIWQPIRRFLLALGFKFKFLQADDSAAYFVNQLRRYVRNGEVPGYVSANQLAANIRALNESQVGRFSVNSVNLVQDGFDNTINTGDQTFMDVLKGSGSNFTTKLGRALQQIQTLDNVKLNSLGLTKMFEVFRRQAATAKSILSYLDGMTKTATRPKWFGLNKNALTDEEVTKASDMLAFGNAYFAQTVTDADIRNQPDVIIKGPDGNPIINEEALDVALDQFSLTPELIRNGFEYLEGGVTRKTFKIDGFDPATNERDALIFKAYLEQRKAINYAAARVALGKYLSATKLAEGNIQNLKDISDSITDNDLDVFRQIRDEFTKIYQSAGQTNSGRYHPDANTIRDAEAFLNGITRALWQDGALADLEAMQPSESKEGKATAEAIRIIKKWNEDNPDNQIDVASMVAGLKRMRAYNIRKEDVMNKIQQPLKNQVFTDTQTLNANVMAKQTMFDSYVPFKRRGDFQLRFQAYYVNEDGSQGKAANVYESWTSAFPYYQSDDQAQLASWAESYNTDLKDTVFEIPEGQDPDGPKVKIKMVAQVGTSSAGTPSNTSMNYDEFASVLNTLGINLDLAERERIVLALSKQHDKARSGLRKQFVAGYDKDMFRSIAEHLETSAAVAAKNEHRTDIDLIMNNPKLWFGDIELLKAKYRKVESAERTGNQESIFLAREEFDAYARMYRHSADINAPTFTYKDKKGVERTIKGMGEGNRYKADSAQLLQFYAKQTDISISAEDMLSKGPLATAKSMAVLMQLGGSIATGFINLTSLPLMAAPLLASYNPQTGVGGGYGAQAATTELIRAGKNLGNKNWADPNWIKQNVLDNKNYKTYGLTHDEAQFLWRETSRGVLDAALVNSLVGTARGNFFKNGTATEASKSYMFVFAYTEQFNRRVTALASYRLEKRRRMASDPTLQESDFLLDDDNQETVPATKDELQAVEAKVIEMVNKSQGDYAMYNRPKLARGDWAQYIYMYKQFTVIAVQLARNLSPKARTYYLTALIAAAGLKGLPFAEDLMDVIDTLIQKFGSLFGIKAAIPTELALAKVFDDIMPGSSQFFLRGLPDNLFFGGTISTRIGLGDLIPGSGMFLEGASIPQELKNIAGPIYSAFAGGVVTAYDTMLLPTKADIKGEAIRIAQASPIALMRNIGDSAMYSQTGAIVNARGYTVTKDLGEFTIVSRLMGFYPSEATRSNDAIRITKRLVDNQKAIVTGYRSQYVNAYLRKDRSAMRDILESVRIHNKAYKNTPFFIDDFKGKVKRATKSASESAGARFLKTTPKSVRSQIEDIVEDYYGVSLN